MKSSQVLPSTVLVMNDVTIATGQSLGLIHVPVQFNNLMSFPVISSRGSVANDIHSLSLPTGRYQSPLLLFRSYRVNPLYRTLFNHSLSSSTYSHSIDPRLQMCRFENKGKCNNTSCAGQHWAEATSLTEDEISKYLLSQYPNIRQPDLSLRDGMTSSEWLLFIAHTIHQQSPGVLSSSSASAPVSNTHSDNLIPVPIMDYQYQDNKR